LSLALPAVDGEDSGDVEGVSGQMAELLLALEDGHEWKTLVDVSYRWSLSRRSRATISPSSKTQAAWCAAVQCTPPARAAKCASVDGRGRRARALVRYR
jgi:hypothetical protein